MKKIIAISSVLMIFVVLMASTQTYATAAPDLKKSTDLPPGLIKATEKAALKGTDTAGKGMMERVGKKYHFRGIIKEASATSLTLTVTGGDMVFTFAEKVKIKVPTLARAATYLDLKPGLQATVQAEKTDTGYLARMVIVVPGKPATGHHVGLVTAYTAGTSITVKDQKGIETTFKLTAETEIIYAEPGLELKVGSRVTVVAPRDVTSIEQTAKAIVVHVDQPRLLRTTTPKP